MTAPLCGSLQTHLGTQMPSGGGHIINADWNANVWFLIMTDGVFHLAMFAALIIALWMLWRGDVRPERLAANTLRLRVMACL